MLSYSNSFSCSTNDKCSEFILTFRQIYPVVAADGNITEQASNIVSEIALSHEGAEALAGLLTNVLNQGKVVD